PTMDLSNGTVKPYRADPSATFTFQVKLTTTVNATPDNYTVWLNLTIISGISFVDQPPVQMTPSPGNATRNPRNGTWYQTQQSLTDEIPKQKPGTKEEPAGKPKSEPSEKAAKAAAYTCTNCGADVGEDDEKCPKCGAVFEA